MVVFRLVVRFTYIFGFNWATICKTVRPMLSDRCLSVCPVLSVTFVHCVQTIGRIKMKLGMRVGLGPGHIVLDGDPAPPPQHSPPIFGPYPLRPNGCIDQDATWYGGRPRPRRHCVRWGPRSPLPKRGRGRAPLQIFGPCLLRPNGWMDEAGTWHGGTYIHT